MSNKLRKRSSLKSKKDIIHKSQNNLFAKNKSKIAGINRNVNRSNLHSDSAINLIKFGGGQMFLNSLRQFSKLSL
jgi:hypothetical protein